MFLANWDRSDSKWGGAYQERSVGWSGEEASSPRNDTGEDHGEHAVVGVGPHAVAAEQLKLVGDHPVHGDLRGAVLGEQEADLDVAKRQPGLAAATKSVSSGRRTRVLTAEKAGSTAPRWRD